MNTGFRIFLLVISCILAGCLIGTAGAASLGIDWKERPPSDSPFYGVSISQNGSIVYAGGHQMYVRSWDGDHHWGGRLATIAAMSADGEYVVQSLAKTVVLLDQNGVESWARTMGGNIQAVAISNNGSFVISADDEGNLNAWGPNGEFYGRNRNATARALAIAPTGDLVVITTDRGLRFYTPALDLVWMDNQTDSQDSFLIISTDGSTVITAGANRVTSHKRDGTLNWQKEITEQPIIDIGCSYDCSAIIVGSQDKEVAAMDRYGTVHWTFPTDQWVNAIGVSRDASVIAVGGNDRNLYILNHGGNLITQRKTDAIIQPRSIAVSSDGKRIVVADQNQLYGFALIGDLAPPPELVTVSRTPYITDETTRPVTTVSSPERTPQTPSTTTSVATGTPASPPGPFAAILAVLGALVLLRKRW
jgi:WD40 repeat protein